MSATALFGNSSGSGSSGGNKHLVELRAGKLIQKGRMLHPDTRKGLLYIYQAEDTLTHFCWKDRTTGHVVDDLLIFPDDCEFVRVNECTTGRVYVLKFKTLFKKYFFWLQEPKTDKDDEYCRRINEVLNNPPTGRSGGNSGGQDGELHNFLNNMSQHQLMQLFGGVGQIGGLSSLLSNMGSSSGNTSSRTSGGNSSSRGGSTSKTESSAARTSVAPVTTTSATAPIVTLTPATTTASAPSRASSAAAAPATATGSSQQRSGQIFLSDLQRYFSELGNAPPDSEGATHAAGTEGFTIDLAATLTSPDVVTTASSPANAQRLGPHLPPASSGGSQDDVRTTLLSPQFAQSANQFSSALKSGQMGPVMTQLGLGPEVASAAGTGNMQDFFKALDKIDSSTKSTEGGNKSDKKKKDEKKKEEQNDGEDLDAMD